MRNDLRIAWSYGSEIRRRQTVRAEVWMEGRRIPCCRMVHLNRPTSLLAHDSLNHESATLLPLTGAAAVTSRSGVGNPACNREEVKLNGRSIGSLLVLVSFVQYPLARDSIMRLLAAQDIQFKYGISQWVRAGISGPNDVGSELVCHTSELPYY